MIALLKSILQRFLRGTQCRARIRDGALILCGCRDCAEVLPQDVAFAEQVAAALRMCTTHTHGGAA